MGHVFFYSALKVIGAVKITLKIDPRKQFFGNIFGSIQYFSMKPNGKKFIRKSNKIICISIVTSKPRRFCFYELEGKRRRRYGRT